MFSEKTIISVLIVSSSEKGTQALKSLLPNDRFSPVTTVSTAGDAKRLLIDKPYDIVLINTPLIDEFGVQLALDISESGNAGVLLFVKAELFETVSYKVEEYGVLTLSRPINKQTVYQSIKLMTATRIKMKALEQKAISLEQRMEEIRTINRAKILLMENKNLSEQEAHRYIEKTAMDKCIKKIVVAEAIIVKYSDL